MVRRLVSALDGADVFLHCDAHAPTEVAEAMVPDGARHVHLIPRRKTSLASWSLSRAEFAGLQMALERSSAEHIAIMSGSSYPLAPLEAIDAVLAPHRGETLLELNKIPFPDWDSPWKADGGMWRFRRRFLTAGDRLVLVAGKPVPLWRRRIPANLVLHGGSQWKTYSRAHAKALLDILNTQPRQRHYWRHVFIAEESCAVSILNSPQLVGDLSERVVNRDVWLIDWPHTPEQAAPHPNWLTAAHFDLLASAARSREKLFARKISSTETELLDRMDAELLS
jgi:Core-2/I-Branching enzyme